MPSNQALDTGLFCKKCGWYESGEPETLGDKCMACGCSLIHHVAAEVVATNE